MENDQQSAVSIQDALGNMASANAEDFRIFFRRMRKMFPAEVTEACLSYLASRGLDAAAQNMAFWLTNGSKYLPLLLGTAGSLPVDIAAKAIPLLKEADPQFLINFLKAVESLSSPTLIMRVLTVLPSLGDYSVLLSWLRKLTSHSDERVRSRSVKLLCGIRPNKALIERQMYSDDPRVRASAIEALWHLRTSESSEIFRSAARDLHHRVVANALVGLHFQGDESAVLRMIELSEHRDPLFRAAMAWCFGFILEKRAVPILHCLTKDSSVMVRKRALRSLLMLQTDDSAPPEKPAMEAKSEAEPIEPPAAHPTQESLNVPLPKFLSIN